LEVQQNRLNQIIKKEVEPLLARCGRDNQFKETAGAGVTCHTYYKGKLP
jgi:hypothetical protein